MQEQLHKLARRHNVRYKLVRSVQYPEELWHIAEWQAATRRWENMMVNMTLA